MENVFAFVVDCLERHSLGERPNRSLFQDPRGAEPLESLIGECKAGLALRASQGVPPWGAPPKSLSPKALSKAAPSTNELSGRAPAFRIPQKLSLQTLRPPRIPERVSPAVAAPRILQSIHLGAIRSQGCPKALSRAISQRVFLGGPPEPPKALFRGRLRPQSNYLAELCLPRNCTQTHQRQSAT